MFYICFHIFKILRISRVVNAEYNILPIYYLNYFFCDVLRFIYSIFVEKIFVFY